MFLFLLLFCQTDYDRLSRDDQDKNSRNLKKTYITEKKNKCFVERWIIGYR